MSNTNQQAKLKYKVVPNPNGLGFVAEARDSNQKLKWRSVNHCAKELCKTEINKHKARQIALLPPVKTITFSDYHRKGFKQRQKGVAQ